MKSIVALLLGCAALRWLLVSCFATVTELGGGAGRYFEEEQKRHKYLSEKGQASSFWHGSGCRHIGTVAGAEVTREQFDALTKNLNPLDGSQLVQRQAGKNIKPGHDLTLGAPKSVAVVGLLGTSAARAAIDASTHAAIESTLERADSRCPRNRGAQGARKELPPENERAWMVFRHLTNRDGEVFSHWHCISHHIAWSNDGTVGRTERRGLLDYQKELGAHFRGRLEAELISRGFETEKTVSRSGRLESFRLRGVPQVVERSLSKRTALIEETIEREGWTSARAKDVASLKTRAPKRHLTRKQLIESTWATCKAHGLDVRAIDKLCEGVTREKQLARGKEPAPPVTERPNIARENPGPEGQMCPRLDAPQAPARNPGGLKAPLEPAPRLPTHGEYASHLLRPTLGRDGAARVLVGESEQHAARLNQGAQRAARTLGRLGMRSVAIFDGKAHVGDRVRLRWDYREGRQGSDLPWVRTIADAFAPKRAERFELGTVEAIVNKRVWGLFWRRIVILRLDAPSRTWLGLARKRVVTLRAQTAARAIELGYATSEAKSVHQFLEPVLLTPKVPPQHVAEHILRTARQVLRNERGPAR